MSIGERKIGVAVVGLGVGEQHVHAYLATGRCELRWLYDLELDKAQSVAEKLGAGKVARSFEEILEDKNVHAVSIASYDDAHYAQVLAALNAGKHVFVEKPLSRTSDELRTIKQAWAKHEGQVKLASNLVLRAAPIYLWLQQEIKRGSFGEIYAFNGDYLYGRLNKITVGWRKAVKDYSVMLGGGIHLVDLMVWLTGQRPISVWAAGNRICTQGSEFNYHDYVVATMQYSSGLISHVTANFGCVHRHQHVMRLFGTKETFIYDDAGPRRHATRDPLVAASTLALATLPKSKGELISPFISAILDDENLNAQTQEIFDVISICNAADQALKNSSMVEIQYV